MKKIYLQNGATFLDESDAFAVIDLVAVLAFHPGLQEAENRFTALEQIP